MALMKNDYETKRLDVKLIDGKLVYKGENWIFLRVKSLESLLLGLWEVFGSGAVTIMIISGEKIGYELAERFKVRPVGEERESAELLISFLSETGWGRFALKEYDQISKRVVIDVYGLSFYRSETPKTVKFCPLLKGVFTGFFSALWGFKASCKEVNCIVDGDGFCRFQVKG